MVVVRVWVEVVVRGRAVVVVRVGVGVADCFPA